MFGTKKRDIFREGQRVLRKTLFYAGVVFFSWAFWLSGCAEVGQKAPEITASPVPIASAGRLEEGMEFGKTKLSSLEKGKDRWELSAGSIRMDQKAGRALARNIKVVFFDASRKPVAEVRSQAAEVDLGSGDLIFRGKVHSRAGTGETLEVERMRWDGKRKKMFGSGSVVLTRKDSVVRGREIEADPSLKNVEISGDVRILMRNRMDFFRGIL